MPKIKRRNFIFGLVAGCGLTALLLGGLNEKKPDLPPSLTTVENGIVLGASEEALAEKAPEALSPTGLGTSRRAPYPPRRLETASAAEPDADCGVIVDFSSGEMLYGRNYDEAVPVASLTKLMTALVFLDFNPGWDKSYKIRPGDMAGGGKTYIAVGEQLRVKDLFFLCLVGSANTAAQALVGAAGLSEEEFVGEMNAKAEALGLSHTRFSDPVGLSYENISTAAEMAEIAKAAFREDYIAEAGLTKKYEFTTLRGRPVSVFNTDALLNVFPQNGIRLIGGKTGYTPQAGYCFAGQFINELGHNVLAVVLKANSRGASFGLTRQLVDWTYGNYAW